MLVRFGRMRLVNTSIRVEFRLRRSVGMSRFFGAAPFFTATSARLARLAKSLAFRANEFARSKPKRSPSCGACLAFAVNYWNTFRK